MDDDTRRAITRFGIGEFSDQTQSRMHARSLFFTILNEMRPWTLRRLHEHVFPIYQELRDTAVFDEAKCYLQDEQIAEMNHSGHWGPWWLWPAISTAEERGYPELAPLCTALLTWATNEHLGEDWMLEIACQTLNDWATDGVSLDYLEWRVRGVTTLLRGRPIQFAHLGWDPRSGFSLDAWLDGARAAFEVYLTDYARESRRDAETLGYSVTPQKRSAEDHFRWLVWYQCGECSYLEITRRAQSDRDSNISREAVMDAIKKTAALIGMELRPPSKGGTPRKRRPD